MTLAHAAKTSGRCSNFVVDSSPRSNLVSSVGSSLVKMWETAEAMSLGFAWEADVRRIESKGVMVTGVKVDVVAIIPSCTKEFVLSEHTRHINTYYRFGNSVY